MVNKRAISVSNLFFYIFSVLLFLFVIYYFSEIKKEFALLKKVNIHWLLSAIVVQLFTYLINAVIYRTLIKGYEVHPLPHLLELYKVSVISLFFNQTVPSAGISGNTFIFNFLLKRNINVTQIFSIILLELLIFYLAMDIYIVFFLIAKLFFYSMPPVFGGLLLGGLIIYLVFASVILLLAKKRSFDFLIIKFKNIKFIKRHFERLVQQLQHPIKPDDKIALLSFISGHKKIVVKIIFWQLLSIVLDALTILLLFYGLGVPISLFIVILVLVCTKIVSILPISPGSLILFESSMVFLFNSLTMPLGISIMVTLIFRLFSFWFPIPAGLLLYRKWLRTKVEI